MLTNMKQPAPYVFQEFPKWVTLADGSKVLVKNEEEEAVLIAPKDERSDLLQQARDLGLEPHHKTGVDKLRQMIADAES